MASETPQEWARRISELWDAQDTTLDRILTREVAPLMERAEQAERERDEARRERDELRRPFAEWMREIEAQAAGLKPGQHLFIQDPAGDDSRCLRCLRIHPDASQGCVEQDNHSMARGTGRTPEAMTDPTPARLRQIARCIGFVDDAASADDAAAELRACADRWDFQRDILQQAGDSVTMRSTQVGIVGAGPSGLRWPRSAPCHDCASYRALMQWERGEAIRRRAETVAYLTDERAHADKLAGALRSLLNEMALEGPDDDRIGYQTYQVTRGEVEDALAVLAAHAERRRDG